MAIALILCTTLIIIVILLVLCITDSNSSILDNYLRFKQNQRREDLFIGMTSEDIRLITSKERKL